MAVEAFLEQFSVEERLRAALALRTKHPDKAPLLVFIDRNIDTTVPSCRMLAPLGSKVCNLLHHLRTTTRVDHELALFMFFGQERKVATGNTLIKTLFNEERSPDGFLYCHVMGENTFGSQQVGFNNHK
jgi:GABA(A) receptor-associated protein